MEDAQSQLEALIVKAKKQKIHFKSIPALKKRENWFRLDGKLKIILSVVFIFGIIFYQSIDLFGAEKVMNVELPDNSYMSLYDSSVYWECRKTLIKYSESPPIAAFAKESHLESGFPRSIPMSLKRNSLTVGMSW